MQSERLLTRTRPGIAGSDASGASSSQATETKPQNAAAARSRMSATEPLSRSASPAAANGRGATARAARGGRKGAGRSRPPSPPPVIYPVWIPPQKGILPDDRREPPLPPIMDSPCYVPKRKKGRVKTEEGENSEDDAMSGSESSEDEETAKKRVARSVALNRPRRGANDVVAFDISRLWT